MPIIVKELHPMSDYSEKIEAIAADSDFVSVLLMLFCSSTTCRSWSLFCFRRSKYFPSMFSSIFVF